MRERAFQAWHAILRWLAEWQIVPVALIAAALVLLPQRLPLYAQASLLLLIPLLWMAHRLARGRFWTPHPLDLPLAVLVVTLPVGLWASPLPLESLPLLFQRLAAVALLYAVVNSLHTAARLRLAAALLLPGTALLSVMGLLGAQRSSKLLPSPWTAAIPRLPLSFWNAASSGFNANIVAGLLAIFVPVTAAYALFALRRPLRPRGLARAAFLGALTAIEGLVLLYTQSRGGLIAFGVALLVVAVSRDRRWLWLLPLGAAALGGLLLTVGPQSLLDLLPGDAGHSAIPSTAGRLELISRGLYMLQDFAFTGIGLGMFSRILPLLYPLFLAGPDTVMPHVHDIYLQAGIEHGLPGLIAFLALLLLLVTMGVQSIRWSRRQPWEPLAAGLLAGLVAFLVHGLVDVVASSPRAQLLIWGHWGLLTALWLHARARRSPDGA